MINQNDRQNIVRSAVEKYYDDIYRFCRYYTGNETDSYDITQDVFLRFMKYMNSHNYRNLKGYLLMIARNLCCDYFHNQSVQRENIVPLDAVETTRQNMAVCCSSIENCDSEIFFDEVLQSIPRGQREVVILRLHDGLKFHEISKITGCSLSTVKSRYRLGIACIRKKMEGDSE